jgi:hypothetical protein
MPGATRRRFSAAGFLRRLLHFTSCDHRGEEPVGIVLGRKSSEESIGAENAGGRHGRLQDSLQ